MSQPTSQKFLAESELTLLHAERALLSQLPGWDVRKHPNIRDYSDPHVLKFTKRVGSKLQTTHRQGVKNRLLDSRSMNSACVIYHRRGRSQDVNQYIRSLDKSQGVLFGLNYVSQEGRLARTCLYIRSVTPMLAYVSSLSLKRHRLGSKDIHEILSNLKLAKILHLNDCVLPQDWEPVQVESLAQIRISFAEGQEGAFEVVGKVLTCCQR